MATPIRVDSIDALKSFKSALIKFAEAAHVALADAEGELQRTLNWLETEQHTHWASEIRKRTEMVARAKDALRQKTLFKNAAGSKDSAIEEHKALALAERRLQEAEQKLANCRRHRARLQKEIDLYKGAVQRLATSVQADLPLAATRLDNMVASLEAYVALPTTDSEIRPVTESQSPDETTSTPDPPQNP